MLNEYAGRMVEAGNLEGFPNLEDDWVLRMEIVYRNLDSNRPIHLNGRLNFDGIISRSVVDVLQRGVIHVGRFVGDGLIVVNGAGMRRAVAMEQLVAYGAISWEKPETFEVENWRDCEYEIFN